MNRVNLAQRRRYVTDVDVIALDTGDPARDEVVIAFSTALDAAIGPPMQLAIVGPTHKRALASALSDDPHLMDKIAATLVRRQLTGGDPEEAINAIAALVRRSGRSMLE